MRLGAAEEQPEEVVAVPLNRESLAPLGTAKNEITYDLGAFFVLDCILSRQACRIANPMNP